MKSYFAIFVAALASASAANAAPIFVNGNTPTPVVIGAIAAGQAYTVTGSGTVSLCSTCNAGGPLVFNPNGTVATFANSPYTALNSGPSDHDPSIPMGSPNYYGFYGPGVELGALYGSFTATPTSAADLFLIGSNYSIAAGSARTLYGVVNDSYYPDNPSTSFSVTLSPTSSPAVPEPATWVMMIIGLGAIGFAMRRRQQVTAQIYHAA